MEIELRLSIELPIIYASNYKEIEEAEEQGIKIEEQPYTLPTLININFDKLDVLSINEYEKTTTLRLVFESHEEVYRIDANYETVKALLNL